MHRYRMGMWGLHSSVCNAPVPDVLHDHFTGFVKHPVKIRYSPTLIRYSDLDPEFFVYRGEEDLPQVLLRSQKFREAGLSGFSGYPFPRCF